MSQLEYWDTRQGFDLRLKMLGDRMTWNSFNNAIVNESVGVGFYYFKVAGPIDERACSWCGAKIDKMYKQGQFMPQLPKHINCRHFWDIYVPKE